MFAVAVWWTAKSTVRQSDGLFEGQFLTIGWSLELLLSADGELPRRLMVISVDGRILFLVAELDK